MLEGEADKPGRRTMTLDDEVNLSDEKLARLDALDERYPMPSDIEEAIAWLIRKVTKKTLGDGDGA